MILSPHDDNTSAVKSLPITTSNISYRFAGMHDVSQISTLTIETYKQSYLPALSYYTDEVLETLFGKSFCEEISKELNNSKYQYIVCEDNTKIIGYAKLEFKIDSAYLDKLYLLKEYQGKGCGHMLIQTCFQLATDHGFKTMTLDVWEKNDKAIQFYKRHGFKPGLPKLFFLFGKIPTGESNIDMTCDDIKPHLDNSLPTLRR